MSEGQAPQPYQGSYPPPGGYPPPGSYPPPSSYPPAGYGYPPPSSQYPYPQAPPPSGYYGAPQPVQSGYGYGPPAPHAYPPPAAGYYPPPGGYYPPPAYGYPPPPHGYYPPPAYPGYPPRGRSRSPRGGRPGDAGKYTCRYFIGIENESEFRVVKRIIGTGGAKMKDIVAKSGGDAKLRLRGKGSGFVERDTEQESQEHLQLCISCPRLESYNIARRMAEDLLREVYGEYNQWCAERGKPDRAPEIKMSERFHNEGGGCGGGGGRGGGGKNKRGGRNRKGSAGPAPAPVSAASKHDSDSDSDGGDDIDRGPAPPNAPAEPEIERLIEQRNQARKSSDFREADRIRDYLKSVGVMLSDEKGKSGAAQNVTTWRYWRP